MAAFDARELESRLKALQGFQFEDRRKYCYLESPTLLEEDCMVHHRHSPHCPRHSTGTKEISYKDPHAMISDCMRNLPLQAVHEDDIFYDDEFASTGDKKYDESSRACENGVGKFGSSNGLLLHGCHGMAEGCRTNIGRDKLAMPKPGLMKRCSRREVDTMSNYAKFKMMKKEKEKEDMAKSPNNNHKGSLNALLSTSISTSDNTSTSTSTCGSGTTTTTLAKSPYNKGLFNARDCSRGCTSPNSMSSDEDEEFSKLKSTSTRLVTPETCSDAFDSFKAMVKCSYDPRHDFEVSIVEMILNENGLMHRPRDMLELLQCYLTLNAKEWHEIIVMVFTRVWLELLNEHYSQ